MSCPEWECPDCGTLTFGFPESTQKWEMKCSKCGKILTHYMYDEELEARAEARAEEQQRMDERHNDDHYW